MPPLVVPLTVLKFGTFDKVVPTAAGAAAVEGTFRAGRSGAERGADAGSSTRRNVQRLAALEAVPGSPAPWHFRRRRLWGVLHLRRTLSASTVVAMWVGRGRSIAGGDRAVARRSPVPEPAPPLLPVPPLAMALALPLPIRVAVAGCCRRFQTGWCHRRRRHSAFATADIAYWGGTLAVAVASRRSTTPSHPQLSPDRAWSASRPRRPPPPPAPRRNGLHIPGSRTTVPRPQFHPPQERRTSHPNLTTKPNPQTKDRCKTPRAQSPSAIARSSGG